MRICRVLGTVVATAKHPTYLGHKVLVVQPLDEQGERQGSSFLAVDVVQAGVGDLVLVMSEGNGVRQILKQQILPIRSLIVGIVDQVEVPGGATAGSKPEGARRASRSASR
ncbi:MAG: EutN/CcmL family microcompartment protein [Deltaproteobacteria bacterium]|nr:EutN/CcmL family microcompartment protein [Deltaproteobacteria bacterium]